MWQGLKWPPELSMVPSQQVARTQRFRSYSYEEPTPANNLKKLEDDPKPQMGSQPNTLISAL